MNKSLEELKTPIVLKSLAYVSFGVAIFFFMSLFLPWRQTVTGEGQVTVFSPMQRPQTIHSQIDARISKWYVNEGDMVKRGDLLLELEELRPEYLDKNQLPSTTSQRIALLEQRNATQRLINSLEQQISSLVKVQNVAVPSAGLSIDQSSDRLKASEQKYLIAQQSLKTAELNFERRKQLFEKGLNSKRDYELAELALVETRSQLQASQAELDIAKRGVDMSRLDLGKVSAETSLKIQEAEARLAQSFEKLAEINSKVYKMDIDIANLSSRIEQRTIYAPVDGQVTRLRVFGSAETIKAGTELATIIPDSSDQAIEIFISDYFAPLVSVGRQVRIQLAGWPGLQFSGWPSVAIGTFAGEIVVIEAVSDEKNQYRLLIKPDYNRINKGLDKAWPTPDVLRPGTKAIGWVILDEVPLWYELWRVLNGFPPTIMEAPTKNKVKGIK
ncbi:MAG: hypothetical protein RLZZ361_1628 [Cyanobacteriota bacterium]